MYPKAFMNYNNALYCLCSGGRGAVNLYVIDSGQTEGLWAAAHCVSLSYKLGINIFMCLYCNQRRF